MIESDGTDRNSVSVKVSVRLASGIRLLLRNTAFAMLFGLVLSALALHLRYIL